MSESVVKVVITGIIMVMVYVFGLITLDIRNEVKVMAKEVEAIKKAVVPLSPEEVADKEYCQKIDGCMHGDCKMPDEDERGCIVLLSGGQDKWEKKCNPDCATIWDACRNKFKDRKGVLVECLVKGK